MERESAVDGRHAADSLQPVILHVLVGLCEVFVEE